MIHFVHGNILDSDSVAIINTVNCEGKMGKGLAYQFKKKYPLMERDYVKSCLSGDLYPGKLHIFSEKNKIIINFPTKNKWREKSKYSYIEEGLRSLIKYINKEKITSISIPPLGVGNGGLSWIKVKKIIMKFMRYLSNSVDVRIYEPFEKRLSFSKESILLLMIYLSINNKNVSNLKLGAHLATLFSNDRIIFYNFNKNINEIKKMIKHCQTSNLKKILHLVNSSELNREYDNYYKYCIKLSLFTSKIINKYDYLSIHLLKDLYSLKNNEHINNEHYYLMLNDGLISKNLLNEIKINYI